MRAIVCGLVALAVTTSGPAAATPSPLINRNPPPAEVANLKLPAGRLWAVSKGASSVAFVSLDQVQRTPTVVTAVVYWVYDPPIHSGEVTANQLVIRARLNCIDKSYQQLAAQAFDGDGDLQMWMVTEAPERSSKYDPLIAHLCDQVPPNRVYNGHAAALSAASAILHP